MLMKTIPSKDESGSSSGTLDLGESGLPENGMNRHPVLQEPSPLAVSTAEMDRKPRYDFTVAVGVVAFLGGCAVALFLVFGLR